MVTDTIEALRPELTLFTTAQEAYEAALELERKFRDKMGKTTTIQSPPPPPPTLHPDMHDATISSPTLVQNFIIFKFHPNKEIRLCTIAVLLLPDLCPFHFLYWHVLM